MSISTLPISYCTNVHPGRTLVEVVSGLETFAVPIRQSFKRPLAVGLWFADSVSRELAAGADRVSRLRDRLAEVELSCHTLNAFPFGDFHGTRVKDAVYLPDWATRERFDYTRRCAMILAGLMPEGREGSVSTLPLGFRRSTEDKAFLDECIVHLLELAERLDELHSETGRVVRLAIEPEPFCQIETTAEAVEFFRRLRDRADARGLRQVADEHLGLCYDVCHQAVEFEEAAESIEALRREDVRINKVQISCAIQLDHPRENAEGRTALAGFVEPRYLHQTFARKPGGDIDRVSDLTRDLCLNPPESFLNAESWRIHFHVPVNETHIGHLTTTRPQLEKALTAVSALDYAPHLEVETYTWEVLPEDGRPPIVEGIARELIATRSILDRLLQK